MNKFNKFHTSASLIIIIIIRIELNNCHRYRRHYTNILNLLILSKGREHGAIDVKAYQLNITLKISQFYKVMAVFV